MANAELLALKAKIERALELLGEPADNWVPSHPDIDRDVVIIGAGQAGLAIAFALKRKGIRNTVVLDAAENGREGPWVNDNCIRIKTPKTEYQAGYIILGTGFETNLAIRAELKNLSSNIALWRDRYQPSETEKNQALGHYPYLGDGFEFLEKQPGTTPCLSNIHCYNYAAVPSFGRAAGDIGSLKHGIPRLITTIVRGLIKTDAEDHAKRIMSFSEAEMTDAEIEELHAQYRDG